MNTRRMRLRTKRLRIEKRGMRAIFLRFGFFAAIVASGCIAEAGCARDHPLASAAIIANQRDEANSASYSQRCWTKHLGFAPHSAILAPQEIRAGYVPELTSRKYQPIAVLGYGDNSAEQEADRRLAVERARFVTRWLTGAHARVVATLAVGGPSRFVRTDASTVVVFFWCRPGSPRDLSVLNDAPIHE